MIVKKNTEREQSIENWMDRMIMDGEEIKIKEKNIYRKVIGKVLDSLDKSLQENEIVIFNHKLIMELKPIQG
jgi:hypothetical protein